MTVIRKDNFDRRKIFVYCVSLSTFDCLKCTLARNKTIKTTNKVQNFSIFPQNKTKTCSTVNYFYFESSSIPNKALKFK